MQEGGSLRNTAECLARLGMADQISFLSAIGGGRDQDDKNSLLSGSLELVGLSTDGLHEV